MIFLRKYHIAICTHVVIFGIHIFLKHGNKDIVFIVILPLLIVLITYKPILTPFHYQDYPVAVLRLDLIHPDVSGNKWFKLKYNLKQAIEEGKDTILTFGGAFSNHIAATAFACKEAGLKSIGLIRGEETSSTNTTLALAVKHGMMLKFVSRDDYRRKTEQEYLRFLEQQFPGSYIIPEGGDNSLGQKGCGEILTRETDGYDSIFCAYGTGTTFKGIAQSLGSSQDLTGIHVLKYKAIPEADLLKKTGNRVRLLNEYHFGGYARHTPELLTFKTWFEDLFNIPLDYVYTAKTMYAVFDLMKKQALSKTKKIMIIHTGGLQGNAGYEERYNLNPSRQVNDAQG